MIEDRMVSQAVTKSLAIIRGDTLLYSRLDSKMVIMWNKEHKSEMTQERFLQMYSASKKKVCDLLGRIITGDRRSSKVRKEQKQAFDELEAITGRAFSESCSYDREKEQEK